MGSESSDKNKGIAAISTGASNLLSSGHFYWHYLGLVRHRQIPPDVQFRLIGNQLLKDGNAIPLFSERAHRRRFRVGLSTVFDYRFIAATKILRDLENGHIRAFYVYEGSLADLALILYLAPRFSRSVFLFNFFWPRDWNYFVERAGWLRSLLTFALRRAPNNVRFTADTPKFAEYLSRKLDVEFDVFPGFSPYQFPERGREGSNQIDLLVMFKRPEELEFALQVIERASEERDLRVAFHGPRAMLGVDSSRTVCTRASLKFFGNDLDHDSYVSLLTSTNTVLLSYLKSHYEFGSSGKLLDAHQAGCAVLVPEGSGVHSQVKHLKLLTAYPFSPGDPARTAEKILNLLDQSRRQRRRSHDFSNLVDYVFRLQKSNERGTKSDRDSRFSNENSWAALLVAGILYRLSSPAGLNWVVTRLQSIRKIIQN